MKKLIFLLFISTTCFSQSLYFPPIVGAQWDTVSPTSLGWCPDKIDTLINFLGQKSTKAFIVLQDGKIAIEKYYGTFTKDSVWYWASAGKSLCGFLVGIAQQEGLLDISDSTSKYLGYGWTSCVAPDEGLITIENQLSMTSGLNDGVPDPDCTNDTCLVCLAQPGTRWAYHNAAYTLLHDVVASAAGTTFNLFTQSRVASHTGMAGLWINTGYNEIYFSTARTMARFGLLMLNNGIWNTDTLLHDTAYFNQMINTSQNLNQSYGYLWWLNGKNSFMVPGLQFTFPGYLIPAAPTDMVAALGKNDQKIHVVPSKNLVLIRMGNAADSSLAAITNFDNEIWQKMNDVFCTTGITQPENRNTLNLKILPNPVDEFATFAISGIANKNSTIKIFNVMGDEVLTQKFINSNCKLQTSDLYNGVYFVEIKTDKATVTKKLVVQHK